MPNSRNHFWVSSVYPEGQTAAKIFQTQYDRAHLDEEGAARLNEHPDFANYLLAGIIRFSAKESVYKMAGSILGKDFISPEEIQTQREGIAYTDNQLAQFAETIPSPEVMEWCRDNGFMIVAGPNRPMSLLQIRAIKKDYFYSKEGGWYAEHAFAQSDKAKTRWIMLRKDPVPQSTSKNWNEQQALLSETEVIPNIAEVAWCVTTYKAVRDAYLLPSVYVRTSSLGWGCRRVDVGDFGPEGLGVVSHLDGIGTSDLGLSAARKQ